MRHCDVDQTQPGVRKHGKCKTGGGAETCRSMIMTKTDTAGSGSLSHNWLALAVFLVVVVGAGSFIGVLNAPGAWYSGLDKPFFNPPNWVFAPVWTLLYLMIAIAGWRLWITERSGLAMKLWFGQLVVNWVWTPVFFTLQLLWPALVVLAVMWLLIVGVIAAAWHADRTSSWLMMPYLAWVSFAGLLNAAVAWLN